MATLATNRRRVRTFARGRVRGGHIKLMLRYSARTQSHLKTRVSTPGLGTPFPETRRRRGKRELESAEIAHAGNYLRSSLPAARVH